MLKRLTLTVFVALLQMMAALAFYQAGYFAYVEVAGAVRRDIAFGLQLHHSLYLFSVLALINALCLVLLGVRRAGLAGLGLCLMLWGLFWLNLLAYMPYRSLLVLTAGFGALALPWLWLCLRDRRAC